MRSDRELLHDALLILESPHSDADELALRDEIRARLAEPEDEPVAWSSADGYIYRSYTVAKHFNNGKEPLPLYRHPRQPVRLTDEEIDNVCLVWRCRGTHLTELVIDMETAFIEKNQ